MVNIYSIRKKKNKDKQMEHLLENELTLNGIVEISSCSSECGFVHYNDGVTIEIYECVEHLENIKDFLDKYYLVYEVRCTQTGDIFNKNYHQECIDEEDYDNSWHYGWCINITGYNDSI